MAICVIFARGVPAYACENTRSRREFLIYCFNEKRGCKTSKYDIKVISMLLISERLRISDSTSYRNWSPEDQAKISSSSKQGIFYVARC